LVGLGIARDRGWTAPDGEGTKPAEPVESDASNHAESAAVEESSSSDETAAEKDEAQ
jgi:NADH-quinone oxidoreductase subunit E